MQIKQVNFEFKRSYGSNIIAYEIIDNNGKVVYENWGVPFIERNDGLGFYYPEAIEAPTEEKLKHLDWLIGKIFDENDSLFFSQHNRESWYKLIGLKFNDVKISTCKNKFEFTNPRGIKNAGL